MTIKQSKVEFERIEVGVLGNVRTKMDSAALRGLADSIRENGLEQPPLVWHKRAGGGRPFKLPDGREVYDRYILIAGNRRHAAIALIREDDPKAFAEIPVSLFTGNEDDALFAQLTENLQREDLTPADTAAGIANMMKRGHSQADIAKKLGLSPSWVSRLVTFYEKASDPLRRAVADGAASWQTAQALVDLPEDEQAAELAKIAAGVSSGESKHTAGRKARERAAEKKGGAVKPPSSRIRQAYETLTGTEEEGPPKEGSKDWVAWRVLGWVLGQGAWPNVLPKLPRSPS